MQVTLAAASGEKNLSFLAQNTKCFGGAVAYLMYIYTILARPCVHKAFQYQFQRE